MARGTVALPLPRRTSLRRQESAWFYILISPWVIGFLAFTLGPMLASLYLAFTTYGIITPPRFTGLYNWGLLIHDPLFWRSLRITVIYTVASVPLRIGAAFLVANLLNQPVPARALFRTIFYIPSVTSGVPVAMLWLWIFNPQIGVLNFLLSLVGIQGPLWLWSPAWVLPSLVLMSVWSIGSLMIIFLAGLQGVPQHLYEAVDIDGGGALAKLRHVTVPMLSPVFLLTLVIEIIGSFQVFTNVYVMTQGGPENASMVYILYLYLNAFQFGNHMGYANTLAWVLFVILLGFSLVIIRSSPLWVYYEGMRTRR